MESRRMTDMNKSKITELIEQENDPKTRALLIVLNSINESLVANTNTVNDIDNQLKLHLVEFKTRTDNEDAIVNKGKGAWWVLGGVFVIAQSLVYNSINHVVDELKSLHSIDAVLEHRITIIEEKTK